MSEKTSVSSVPCSLQPSREALRANLVLKGRARVHQSGWPLRTVGGKIKGQATHIVNVEFGPRVVDIGKIVVEPWNQLHVDRSGTNAAPSRPDSLGTKEAESNKQRQQQEVRSVEELSDRPCS